MVCLLDLVADLGPDETGIALAQFDLDFLATYRAAWEQQLKAVQRGQYYGGSLLLVLQLQVLLVFALLLPGLWLTRQAAAAVVEEVC